MKKLTVIGHYAFGQTKYDGQTVKTRILCDELKKKNAFDMNIIDTFNWKHNIVSLFSRVIKACVNDDYVVMMPDFNGFRVFSYLLPIFEKFNRKGKLIYILIGGWLAQFVADNSNFLNQVKKFDAVIVETEALKDKLSALDLNNLYVVPNFKNLNIVDTFKTDSKPPYRFCMFSRIFREKGVEDAIECICRINSDRDENIATLDIYGQVEDDYKERFEEILRSSPDYISYKGKIAFDKSVEVLSEYFALFFPTTCSGECHAGTVIDAFASGLPVIAYNWELGRGIVNHGVDGLICEAGTENLISQVEFAIDNSDVIDAMRPNCAEKAKHYLPQENVEKLIAIFNGLQ